MRKHENTIWLTRFDKVKPYQVVRHGSKGFAYISFFPGNKQNGIGVSITRKDARLLAKRINQFLDETKG